MPKGVRLQGDENPFKKDFLFTLKTSHSTFSMKVDTEMSASAPGKRLFLVGKMEVEILSGTFVSKTNIRLENVGQITW